FPTYLPASPGAAQNEWLATTIVSGAGTTNIVVANNAGATASGQTALHDNSKNTVACLAASTFSTPCYLTGGPFNASTILTSSLNNTRLVVPSAIVINQPWVYRSSGGMAIQGGQSNTNDSFQFTQISKIFGAGHAYPVFEMLPTTTSGSGFTSEN